MKKIMIITAFVALISGVTLAKDTKSKSTPDVVKISNFNFTPQTITVHPGTKVTWVNEDDVPHIVMSDDQKFKSRALDTDDRYSYTFSAPGTYKYFCSVHPHMTGKIVVK